MQIEARLYRIDLTNEGVGWLEVIVESYQMCLEQRFLTDVPSKSFNRQCFGLTSANPEGGFSIGFITGTKLKTLGSPIRLSSQM